MYIFSKKNKKKLIACIFKFQEKLSNRIDLSPPKELLQVGIIKIKKNYNLKKHLHTNILRTTKGTQETWIIMKGQIQATYFDLDKKKISQRILNKGDISILYNGGHSLKCLKKNSIIYEIKNGPYKKNIDIERF